ncbi:MAG TPA: glycerophosphodiester phosphodiesterase family protein [Phycicoccus sp.]|jgi:glycerophosphoryl diester phosphodiesterase|nr:glycerophosphodiester phosphodiesterase family protein [Phycicoccus sp.]HQH06244.1 glycerophosphodiester phosphodiesterase family protein [Phycicoccus sp.]HQK30161.1 glycerophosphodiester phosphodiesterase family protein [Phycicoccus sp.]HQV90368.1 glycerophosphodiester phosphodiesterase family protein [Phycicoccus sp.]
MATWPHVPFDLQGHRGARGLAPESTVASFDAALAAGITGVEFDVRLTGDGEVVVWHDPTLEGGKCVFDGDDLTNARVADLTLEQLRTVDIGALTLPAFPEQVAAPGSRILTLAELFSRYAVAHPTLWWTVELKVDPTDPDEVATREELTGKVVEAIKVAGVEGRSFVHSFDWAVLELAREIDSSLILSALTIPGLPLEDVRPWTGSLDPADFPDEVAAAAALGASVFSPYWTWCTPANVERAHDLGLAVLPWTVNEPADIESVRAAGVDGLVTDYPDRVTLA